MSEMALSGQGPDIRITRVVDSFGTAGPGQTNRVKWVYFKVDGLDETYVEVPLTDNWVEEARSAVIQHAADLLELKHTSFGPG